MNRLLLATIILALFSLGVQAQNYNPKFDKAPDLGEFRKAATEAPALQINVPYPPVVGEAAKTISLKEEVLPSLRKEFLRPGAGYFYGPYPPRIYNSIPYQNGQPYIPLLQAHETPMAYKLIAQWNDSINKTRGELLDEANTLDPKDRALYAEAVQLDQNAAALNKEREQINAEVAQWNQQCAGQYPTPHCTSWGNELDKKLASIKQRIAIHNANVDKWRARKSDFDGVVGAFVNKIISWEERINTFISDAKEALATHGTCTEEQWRPLYDAVKDNCDVTGGRRCEKWHDCPTLQKNLAQNRACLDARIKIKNECYTNVPDPGDHTQPITDALTSINNCLTIMDAMVPPCVKCGGSVSIPARRYGGY